MRVLVLAFERTGGLCLVVLGHVRSLTNLKLSCYEEAQAKKVERLCRQREKFLDRPQLFVLPHLRSQILRNRDNLPHLCLFKFLEP